MLIASIIFDIRRDFFPEGERVLPGSAGQESLAAIGGRPCLPHRRKSWKKGKTVVEILRKLW